MTFVFAQYLSYTSTLREFELLADHVTDPRFQNVKMLHFLLWSDLDPMRVLNLKMFSMDYVYLDGAFERRLAVSIRFVSETIWGGGVFALPPQSLALG